MNKINKNDRAVLFIRYLLSGSFLLLCLLLLILSLIKNQQYLYYMAILSFLNCILIFLIKYNEFFAIKYWIVVIISSFIILDLSLAFIMHYKYDYFPGVRLGKYYGAFSFHPSLGGLPTPNYNYSYGKSIVHHNSIGFRGAEPDGWVGANKRIITIGGSSTYCLGISDTETWPYKLEKYLGNNIKVLNMGVIGHSSAEHIIMTSLIVPPIKPDIILYYMGWNDITNSHFSNLKPDYFYHRISLYESLGIIHPPSAIFATSLFIKHILQVNYDYLRIICSKKPDGKISPDVDYRLLKIYEKNITIISSIAKSIGAVPVFIPQILNYNKLTSNKAGWWRFVPDKAVPKINDTFNLKMSETASRVGAYVIDDVLKIEFGSDDFLDRGHFTDQGTTKFAITLANQLKKMELLN
jgi:hypothetical protein